MKAEVDEALKTITENYNSRVERVGNSYAERWEKITGVSAEEAWRRLFTKVNKILQAPEVAGDDANIIDILLPFLSRIIRDRSTEHGMSLDINLFSKYLASDNRWYYHWQLKKAHSIPQADGSTKSVPAIEIMGVPFTYESSAALLTKERKPLLKTMTFLLSDVNVLELYEMAAPYLESE